MGEMDVMIIDEGRRVRDSDKAVIRKQCGGFFSGKILALAPDSRDKSRARAKEPRMNRRHRIREPMGCRPLQSLIVTAIHE